MAVERGIKQGGVGRVCGEVGDREETEKGWGFGRVASSCSRNFLGPMI